MKNLLGVIASLGIVSCAPSYTTHEAAPVTAPAATVAMTPVSRSADGMVLAHAALSGWGPAPAALPPGAQAIVLEGDPSKAELFTVRLKLPNNYTVPPHWHTAWEHITVISGIFHLGMGERVDPSKFSELRAGSFAALPSRMPHYVHVVGETIVQLHGMGPLVVNYVNRTDDPRNR